MCGKKITPNAFPNASAPPDSLVLKGSIFSTPSTSLPAGSVFKESALFWRHAVSVQKSYGGLEGEDSMYIKLISADDHEFIVKREHAKTSKFIRTMLESPGPFVEKQMNTVKLPEITSHILHQVCLYFAYKVRYKDTENTLEFPVTPENAVSILMAANFLDC